MEVSDFRKQRLTLTVSPFSKQGGEIVAAVEALNVSETVLELHAPDTVVISPPHRLRVGAGTYKKKLSWTVEHVMSGTTTLVDISVRAGHLVQKGLCRVTK